MTAPPRLKLGDHATLTRTVATLRGPVLVRELAIVDQDLGSKVCRDGIDRMVQAPRHLVAAGWAR